MLRQKAPPNLRSTRFRLARATGPRSFRGPQTSHKEDAKEPLVYFDPANKTLDLSRPNREIFARIAGGVKDRSNLRIASPARQWIDRHTHNLNLLAHEVNAALEHPQTTLQKTLLPLAVGDIVLFDIDSTELHIVAQLPAALASNIYTFVNAEGEVVFRPRAQIRCRVPLVLSKAWVEAMELVVLEEKHPGIAPMGVPMGPAGLTSKRDDKNAGLGQKLEPALYDPAESADKDTNLVTQAASQLLADSPIHTYTVTFAARRTYSHALTQLSLAISRVAHRHVARLDRLLETLQVADGEMILSPRTFPFFELLSMVTELAASAEANTDVFGGTLARLLGENPYVTAPQPVCDYIACIIALTRSSRRWKLNFQQSSKTPISVELFPAAHTASTLRVLSYLKGDGPEEFARFYTDFVQQKQPQQPRIPLKFTPVVKALEDFVAGNLAGDFALDSLMGGLVRTIDQQLAANGLSQAHIAPFSYEFSRARAHELVMPLRDSHELNPMKWNLLLAFAGSGASRDADLLQTYLDFIDIVEQRDGEEAVEESDARTLREVAENFYQTDPMAAVREDFGDVPVYCIDSETAHEIDDGISIQELDSVYRITVHVANPTSFIRPDSVVSQIAFLRGTTTYLPEGPAMMLPAVAAQMLGLNGTGETRTIAFEFDLHKPSLQAYFEQVCRGKTEPSDLVAQRVLEDIEATARVRFYRARNFPKNHTYAYVNRVLNDSGNVAAFRAGQLPPNEHNLFRLFHISTVLKHARVSVNGGLEFAMGRPKLSVKYAEPGKNAAFQRRGNGYAVELSAQGGKAAVVEIAPDSDQDHVLKSQQLVSNLMIAANYAGCVYAQREKLSIIHRAQQLEISQPVRDSVQSLSRRSYQSQEPLSVNSAAHVMSIMTLAVMTRDRGLHESLGLPAYSNFTSPLRRYVDMANHWQIQDHVLQHHVTNNSPGPAALFSDGSLECMARHLQTRDFINKGAQRFSERFWTAQFLQRYFSLAPGLTARDRIAFRVLLKSDATHGDVAAELVGFNSVRATILQSAHVTRKFALGEWSVGQVVECGEVVLARLDYIEHALWLDVRV